MNWKIGLGITIVIAPFIEDILVFWGANMEFIRWGFTVFLVIAGLILIWLGYKDEIDKRKKRRKIKRILERLPNEINISIESMWQSRDHKKITFLIKIYNPTSIKFEPYQGNLSFFKGESATDERLIDDKDLKRGRRGQTVDDIPPKDTGNIGFTLPVKVGDLFYHTYRISLYIDFKTKYGTCTKKEDFIINCGNRFLEPALKDKDPITIMRDSDGEVKWLSS